MKVAILIKDKEISEYPADLLIDGKVLPSFNLEFEVEVNNIDLLIGKSLPSSLIKKLRAKGVTFFKVNSIEEIDGLCLNVKLPSDIKIKRGAGCGLRLII